MTSGSDAPPKMLDGIRVIDYSHFLAGPYLSRCLAAMGADVVKVERPTGGDASRQSPHLVAGYSGYFMQQNMGKRGLCVDIKDRAGPRSCAGWSRALTSSSRTTGPVP